MMIMKKFLLILFLLNAFLFSCKKEKDSNTTTPTGSGTGTTATTSNGTNTTTGSISGSCSPAGAATGITATVVVNGQMVTYNATPDNNGGFEFKDLPQGSYVISFAPASGYTITNRSVGVMAGKNVDMGSVSITLTPGSLSGTISPAGAASQIRITDDNTHVAFYITPDSKTGIFKSNILLSVGTYTLSATPALGYIAPTSKSITVTTGQNTDAGTIIFTQMPRGIISGTLSPASSVSNVLATLNGSVWLQYKATADANGHFQILDVIPGTYSIAVLPVAVNGFYAPNSKIITVSGAQDTKLGQINLTSTPPPYPASATIDGTALNATHLLQTAYTSSKITMSASLGGFTLNMVLNGVTGPGDYSCNSTSNSTMTLTKVTVSTKLQVDWLTTVSSQAWRSDLSTSGMTVKVTSIDPVTQTITGTFSGTLNPAGNTSGVKTITNGNFVIPYTKS